MRLLYVTDSHLRGVAPRNRTDDFVATLKAKLREVVDLANELEVAAVLHGGDVFDMPMPGLAASGEYAGILRELAAPLYIVPGNHDLHGQNPATLMRTLLGFLGRWEVLRILDRRLVYLDDGNVRVQISGAPFHFAIDDGGEDYVVKKIDSDVAIHICHGALLDRGFGPMVKYTLIDDIASLTEADYTLCGHYHLGFPDAFRDGKWFLNPGALVRLSASQAEMARWPSVVVLYIEGERVWHETIKLKCAQPGEAVLDRSRIEDAAFRARKRQEFLQSVRQITSQTGFARTDPEAILLQVLEGMKEKPEFKQVQAEVSALWSEVMGENTGKTEAGSRGPV
ncbi:MAG: metallophosphoesterase [Bacillota bacterium]